MGSGESRMSTLAENAPLERYMNGEDRLEDLDRYPCIKSVYVFLNKIRIQGLGGPQIQYMPYATRGG